MSAETFSPVLWSHSLQLAYRKRLVYADARICNRKYEGEIRQHGDTVKIKTVNDPTIKDYVKGTDHDAPENADGAEQLLRITQQKYFNLGIDDIDRVQADPEYFAEYTSRGGYQLANTSDQYIASQMSAAVASANLLGSDAAPIVPTADTMYEYLVDLDVILDENFVPEDGRFVVLPPWAYGLLRKDDRFVSFGTDANRNVAAGTPLGEVANLTVFKSNNVPATNATKYKILAGHADATTFAEQMLGQLEAYRPQLRFEDAVKQLQVYGARVTRGYALGLLTANKS